MDDPDERLVQLLADAFRLDIERREQAVADETPDVRAPALAAAAALGAELSDEPSQVSVRQVRARAAATDGTRSVQLS